MFFSANFTNIWAVYTLNQAVKQRQFYIPHIDDFCSYRFNKERERVLHCFGIERVLKKNGDMVDFPKLLARNVLVPEGQRGL
jgi:hypothetical protein